MYVNSDRAMYVGPSMVQSLSLSKTVLGKYSRTLQVNKTGYVLSMSLSTCTLTYTYLLMYLVCVYLLGSKPGNRSLFMADSN